MVAATASTESRRSDGGGGGGGGGRNSSSSTSASSSSSHRPSLVLNLDHVKKYVVDNMNYNNLVRWYYSSTISIMLTNQVLDIIEFIIHCQDFFQVRYFVIVSYLRRKSWCDHLVTKNGAWRQTIVIICRDEITQNFETDQQQMEPKYSLYNVYHLQNTEFRS